MKMTCPICNELKETVGPKVVAKDKKQEKVFTRETMILNTIVMCEDCLEKFKKGEIIIHKK